MFSEESCSVIGLSEKIGFQLRSELGPIGDCCAVNGGQVEVFQTTGAAMEKLR